MLYFQSATFCVVTYMYMNCPCGHMGKKIAELHESMVHSSSASTTIGASRGPAERHAPSSCHKAWSLVPLPPLNCFAIETNHLLPPTLGFPICSIRRMLFALPTSGCAVKIKWDDKGGSVWKTLYKYEVSLW